MMSVAHVVWLGFVAVLACAAACSGPPPAELPRASPERATLAPSGTLRVGINFGNVLLTARDAATSEPRGVAVDLATELARRLGVPLQIVPYESAGALADAATSGVWEVGFLGAEPQRAAQIDFTAPYVHIESSYLVPAGSPIKAIGDADRPGVRIAVAEKSAYDLALTRLIKQASIERTAGIDNAFKRLVDEKMDALAGLKPVLFDYVEKLPGSRVVDGSYSTVQQAVGTPKGHEAAVPFLRSFVEDVKASGLVAQLIEKNSNARGLTVAPPAAP